MRNSRGVQELTLNTATLAPYIVSLAMPGVTFKHRD